MAETGIEIVDREAEFLASNQETGFEWEHFKENVRPLKRGRNVRLLNNSLKSHIDDPTRKNLIEKRRKLISAIDEYDGDDPLLPWIECIKWVQEAFPQGGDSSGLVVIYEQCVRKFWHSEHYRNDLRYLKVWLEYAEHCDDAEVIYKFLEVNEIGNKHASYYIAHALHMESKSKVKTANEIFNLGISRNATPEEKLKDAYQKFVVRSMRPKITYEEEASENDLPPRSFGTIISRGGNNAGSSIIGSPKVPVKRMKPNYSSKTPLSVYKDSITETRSEHQPEKSNPKFGSWLMLGGRADRNKENNPKPGKLTEFKVPQRPFTRTAATHPPSASFQVFVDEECTEEVKKKEDQSTTLPLKEGREIKKETELLKQDPLRNFPRNSLFR